MRRVSPGATTPSPRPCGPVDVKSGSGENYKWSQTDDEVEIVVTCPASEKPLKSRVKVSYGRGDALTVLCDGVQLIHWSPLFAPIDPSGCSWTIDGSTIVVTLEKREEREWHTRGWLGSSNIYVRIHAYDDGLDGASRRWRRLSGASCRRPASTSRRPGAA